MPATAHHRGTGKFIERTMASFARAIDRSFYAEELARSDGLLQRLDPRVKLLGIAGLVVALACAHKLWVIAGLFVAGLLLAALSRVPFGVLMKRVWIAVLLFTGIIALPAPFVTPGRTVYRLPWTGWAVTAQGLTSAGYLVARVETAATLMVLLVLTTRWSAVLKALRVFRAPVVLVAVLGMTYRYLFLLLETGQDMFESRRSRMVGELDGPERRRVATASAGVLLSKTFDLSSEVYTAMQSRGFNGEILILDEFKARRLDGLMLAAFVLLAAAAFWLGR